MLTASVTKSAEEIAAEEELKQAQSDMRFEMAQAAVDLAGIVDPTPISDTISASMSLYKGDLIGAGLSLISIVPYVGDALGKTLKRTRAAERIAKLEQRILSTTIRLKKIRAATEKAAAEAKIGKKSKATGEPLAQKAREIKDKAAPEFSSKPSKSVGQCPAAERVRSKVDKARKADRLKKSGYPTLKLRPNWKNKLKDMSSAERKAALTKRAAAREYWLDKATKRKGSNLTKEERKKIDDKIDSFDWSQYEKINNVDVKQGEKFNRVVDQGNTSAGKDGFLSRTKDSELPKSSTEARESRALPDTSKSEELSHFEATKDFEVMEGPLDGGSWAYHDDKGAVIAIGPQRTGGGSQSVTMDGADPNSLVKHTGSTQLP